MENMVSLNKVIGQAVLELGVTGNGEDNVESVSRMLRRKFNKFLESCGGDLNKLKNEGRTIEFTEGEAYFIKVIIKKLYKEEGLVASLLNNEATGSREIHDFIQSLLDDESKRTDDERELVRLAQILMSRFRVMSIYLYESCHEVIDYIATNINDTSEEIQIVCFNRVLHFLKKLMAAICTEMILIQANEVSEYYFAKSLYIKERTDDSDERYIETDPEIRKELIDIDKKLFDNINGDDTVRRVIEEKFGKSLEDVFNYAFIDE